MVKISRSAFFSMMVASGAILLLDGCGSGTPHNSTYVGAYQTVYTINQTRETGEFNFTVDVKGKVSGTFTNNQGLIRDFTGAVKNTGAINGQLVNRSTNVTSSLSGTIGGTPGAATSTITGGNFTFVEGGVTNSGDFVVSAAGASTTSLFRGGFSSDTSVDPTFVLIDGTNLPANTVPAAGHFSIVIDQEGAGIGAVEGEPSVGSSTLYFTGTAVPVYLTVANDGNCTGTINGYPFTGKLSLQVIPFSGSETVTNSPTPISSPSPTASPSPSPTAPTTSKGVVGNIQVTIQGKVFLFQFFGGGGFTA